MDTMSGIDQAIAAVGGNQSELARQVADATGLPVRQGHVSYWKKVGYVSGEEEREAVARLSGVPVERLRRPKRHADNGKAA